MPYNGCMSDPLFEIDLNSVRTFLLDKEMRRKSLLDVNYAMAGKDFNRIVDRIISNHGPLRIYQWGSLLDRSKFSEISDIDIAVEGLSGPEQFSALLGEVSGMTDFPLDIIEMERVGEENARYIREHGRLVYERPSDC